MADVDGRRWVLIEDDNSISNNLRYSGEWHLDTYGLLGRSVRSVRRVGSFEVHHASTVARLAFSFEGTRVAVRGRSRTASKSRSFIQCSIDGVEGKTDVDNSSDSRPYRLCFENDLNPGLHEVVVDISADQNSAHWIDAISYLSLPNPNLSGRRSRISLDDKALQYFGDDWRHEFIVEGSHGRETYSHGERVTIPFHGTSLEIHSYLTAAMPHVEGSASYSIDGGPPVVFQLPTHRRHSRRCGSDDLRFLISALSTPPLRLGHHTLELVNLGNSSTTPLSIDTLTISHGISETMLVTPNLFNDAMVSSTVLEAAPVPHWRVLVKRAASNQSIIAPIVGGIVGGAAVLVCAAIIFYCWWSRRREKEPKPPSRLTAEEAAAWNMRSRDLAVATSPYLTEPTPDVFNALSQPPQAQRRSHRATRHSNPSWTRRHRSRQPSAQSGSQTSSSNPSSSNFSQSPPGSSHPSVPTRSSIDQQSTTFSTLPRSTITQPSSSSSGDYDPTRVGRAAGRTIGSNTRQGSASRLHVTNTG